MEDGLKLYTDTEVDTRKDGIRGNIPSHLKAYFTAWYLQKNGVANANTCNSRDICTFVFSFTTNIFLGNCELRFIIANADAVIINSSSLDNKGATFSINPGEYTFKTKIEIPLKKANYNVQVVFISDGVHIDLWDCNTKLIVLDNFETNVKVGLLNLDSVFEIEETGLVNNIDNKVFSIDN